MKHHNIQTLNINRPIDKFIQTKASKELEKLILDVDVDVDVELGQQP